MIAIVTSVGMLAYTFSGRGMANVSESYANLMTGRIGAVSEKFAVEQVTFTTGSSALTIDGSPTAQFSTTNSGTITLTTTNSNDVIVLLVGNEDATNAVIRTVSTVTASGLTFVQRSSKTLGAPSYQDTEVWWAIASSPLSAVVITVTLSGSTDDAAMNAFGVSGANTASPWDSNAALPATTTGTAGTTPSVSGVSTSNAKDMILGFQGNGNGAGNAATVETPGSGFTLISNIDNEGAVNAIDTAAEDEVVSTTQSSITVAFGTSTSVTDDWMMIGDAIQANPPGADVYVRNVGRVPTTLVSVYIIDLTANTFVSQTTISNTVNVGTFVQVPHSLLTFTPSHGHTYSFAVTSSLGTSVIYNVKVT